MVVQVALDLVVVLVLGHVLAAVLVTVQEIALVDVKVPVVVHAAAGVLGHVLEPAKATAEERVLDHVLVVVLALVQIILPVHLVAVEASVHAVVTMNKGDM